MLYLTMKHLHMTLALISIVGFMIRGALSMKQHPIMQRKWIRVLPHINDTLLLLAAVYLAWTIQQHPFNSAWIAAKVVALVAYVLLGTVVIKRKGSFAMQLSSYVLAITSFAYIVGVAITKSPWLIH